MPKSWYAPPSSGSFLGLGVLNAVRGVGRADAVGVAVAQIMEVGPVAAVALPSAVAKVDGEVRFPVVVRSVSCVAVAVRTMCCFAVGRSVFDVAVVVRSTLCFAALVSAC